jgi:hypothetical protein
MENIYLMKILGLLDIDYLIARCFLFNLRIKKIFPCQNMQRPHKHWFSQLYKLYNYKLPKTLGFQNIPNLPYFLQQEGI